MERDEKLRHVELNDEELEQGLLLKLELASDPTVLCAVRGAVERLTESFGFSPEESRAITRAVDEALTNIIRHAYDGKTDQPIEVILRSVQARSAARSGAGLEVVLYDRGPAIDPKSMCARALEEVKPGGLGLHFIKQSMDIVEYDRAHEHNRLRLVKYVRRPQGDAKP